MIESSPGQWSPCDCNLPKHLRAVLPPHYQEARLEQFAITQLDNPKETIAERVRHWIAAPADGLFILGPAGSGKTHLAAAIVRELVFAWKPVLFLRVADFLRELRRHYAENESEIPYLDELAAIHWLALDDVGTAGLGDHQRSAILDLIDRRINDCHPTIVTSNWTLAEICERMDDRLANRLGAFGYLGFPFDTQHPDFQDYRTK
jgi:DNA replication protein DnaC